MSRVNALPEIEEVAGPEISTVRVNKPRKPQVSIQDPASSQPAVSLTPKNSRDFDGTPPSSSPEPPVELRQKRRKKDDSTLILDILNMLVSRVDQNANNINRYVLKRFEGEGYEDQTVRKEKTNVETRVIFMKIIDVDTLKQEFKAELFVQARWTEPKLRHYTAQELEHFRGEGIWTPKVILTNLVGDPDEDDTWYVAHRYPDYDFPTVTMRRKVTASFSEILELNDFPLDVQELTVQISSRRSEQEVVLVQDKYRTSTVNVDAFLDQDQFELYPHVITSSGQVSSELTSMRDRHSAIFFSASVKRKSGYFFWNIFLMMFIISSLAFTAFAIKPTLPHNRLAVTLTLLLTAIAFKFIINKSIPQIPYLTYLDIYVLGCMLLLAAHSIENALITIWAGNTDQSSVDLYMLVFLATCHVSFNVAYLIFLIVMNRKANKEIDDRSKSYEIQKALTDDRRKKMKRQVDEDMYAPIH